MGLGHFDAVAGFSAGGIRLLCGYVQSGQPRVLDSLFASGRFFKDGVIADTDLAAALLKQAVADAVADLKTPIRSLSVIIPALDTEILKGYGSTATIGECVSELDGQNCLGVLRKRIVPDQAARLVGVFPYAYALDGNADLDGFPQGLPAANPKVTGLVFLASQPLLESVRTVPMKAGLAEPALFVSPQATARFLASSPALPDSYLLLDIGNSLTQCAYAVKGNVAVTGTASCGGENLTAAVQKSFRISYELANRYKKVYGLAPDPAYAFKTPAGFSQQELADVLEAALSPVVELVGRIETQVAIDSEKNLVLTGGGSALNGLSEWLCGKLGKKVFAVTPQIAGARYRGDADLLGALLALEDQRWMTSRRETRTGLLRRTTQTAKDGGDKE